MISSKKLNKIKNTKNLFFSRKGGVSAGIYKSLNCGIGSRDSKANILKNLNIVKEKFRSNNLNLVNQIHSNKIITLTKKTKALRLGKADGIFTSLNNNLIGILTADCIPILMSSKCGYYICALHGGWKGLYKNIIKNAVNLFKKNNVNPKDIICGIGPSIGQNSYEVQKKFMIKIIRQNQNYQKLFLFKKDKIFFNLQGYALEKFKEQNIKINQIDLIQKDTYSLTNHFFSYRRSVHKNEYDYGRNISIIVKTESSL